MIIYLVKLNVFYTLQSLLYNTFSHIGIAVLGTYGIDSESARKILPLMWKISLNQEMIATFNSCGMEIKHPEVLLLKQQVYRAIGTHWLNFLTHHNENFASITARVTIELNRDEVALHLKGYYTPEQILLQAMLDVTQTLPTTKKEIDYVANKLQSVYTEEIINSLVEEHIAVHNQLKCFLSTCPKVTQSLEEFIHDFLLAANNLNPLRRPLNPAPYEYRGVKNLIIKASKEQRKRPQSWEEIKKYQLSEQRNIQRWSMNGKQITNYDGYSAYFLIDENAILNSFLAILTPAQRRVMETFYRYCDYHTQDKMATMLGLKPTTFNKYLKTARDRLKAEYYRLQS